jgi:acetylornithine deacetylase
MTAWVDAALLNEAGIPAVCFGPGSIAQAHSADEWVDVDEIRRATRTLTRFSRAFLSDAQLR